MIVTEKDLATIAIHREEPLKLGLNNQVFVPGSGRECFTQRALLKINGISSNCHSYH